jgi:hypothetical protein
MKARQFASLDDIFPPTVGLAAAPTTGTVLLIGGVQMSGSWTYNLTAELADFTDSNGQRWIIPMESVVAYSPQVAAPLRETTDAQNP